MQLELRADMLTDTLRAAGLVKTDTTPQLVTYLRPSAAMRL
ncbi:MAG: hypothetical protein ACRDSZ_05350 [Pseudonocardiaceae bacterium]